MTHLLFYGLTPPMKTIRANQGRKFRKTHDVLRLLSLAAASLLPVGPCLCAAQVETNQIFLTVEEMVAVVNENSPHIVNVYVDPSERRTPIPIHGSFTTLQQRIRDAQTQDLLSLLGRATNYSVTRQGPAFTVLPRSFASNATEPLKTVIPHFAVTNANLFVALFHIVRVLPFSLEVGAPIVTTRGIAPDLTIDYPHWNREDMPVCTFRGTNVVLIDLLSELVNVQGKAYWVAYHPPAFSIGKEFKGPFPLIGLEIHHRKESRTSYIGSKAHLRSP